jgi:hypothetical protein
MWTQVRNPQDRRGDQRLSTQLFLNEYVDDDGQRSLVRDLSVRGLRLQRVTPSPGRDRRAVGLELVLPGTSEIIWARAEPRFDRRENAYHCRGLMFAGMARKHMRLLSDYLYEEARLRREFARAVSGH